VLASHAAPPGTSSRRGRVALSGRWQRREIRLAGGPAQDPQWCEDGEAGRRRGAGTASRATS